jgi:hypothetical protein
VDTLTSSILAITWPTSYPDGIYAAQRELFCELVSIFPCSKC